MEERTTFAQRQGGIPSPKPFCSSEVSSGVLGVAGSPYVTFCVLFKGRLCGQTHSSLLKVLKMIKEDNLGDTNKLLTLHEADSPPLGWKWGRRQESVYRIKNKEQRREK